jgi:hypothetical protein
MRISAVALLVMIVGCSALGQQTASPILSYDDISYPDHRYEISVSSLHAVDFQNLEVFWFDGQKPGRGARLRNGAFLRRFDGGLEKVKLHKVNFIGPPQSQEQRVVIDLSWSDCGGSCTVVGLVQVFELRAGHPTVVQEIEYDAGAEKAGVRFDPRTQVLTIVGRSNDHTPNCCPKNLDVMRFYWDGKKFAFRGTETKPVTDTKIDVPVVRH